MEHTQKNFIVSITAIINKNTPEEWRDTEDFTFETKEKALEFRSKCIASDIKYNVNSQITKNF